MKKYLLLLLAFMVVFAVHAFAQDVAIPAAKFDLIVWIKSLDWVAITGYYFTGMAILKIIAKATPTDKDDKFVALLEKLQTLFMPDVKKGGGIHK